MLLALTLMILLNMSATRNINVVMLITLMSMIVQIQYYLMLSRAIVLQMRNALTLIIYMNVFVWKVGKAMTWSNVRTLTNTQSRFTTTDNEGLNECECFLGFS